MGLKGWFGNLLKKAIKTIAVAVASYIHPAVGLAFGGAITDWIDTQLSGSFWMNGPAMRSGLSEQQNEAKAQQLLIWVENNITEEWIKKVFFVLTSKNGNPNYYKSDLFRKNINSVLLVLEALRLYYKGNMSKSKSFDFDPDDIIENSTFETKSDLFLVLQQSLRHSYEKAMKDAGIPIYLKTLYGFRGHDYRLVGKTPENINFDFVAFSDIALYAFSPNQQITITYKDFSTATASENAQVPNTPSPAQSSEETKGEINIPGINPIQQEIPGVAQFNKPATTAVTNQNVKTAGLWIGGLIVGGWLWKKFINQKPQKK